MRGKANKQMADSGRNPDGTFAEGHELSTGRPKGSKNKFTTLKQAFLDAFEELGGVEGLVEWAEKNSHTKEQFYKMITKMLPTHVTDEVKGKIELELKRIITEQRPDE